MTGSSPRYRKAGGGEDHLQLEAGIAATSDAISHDKILDIAAEIGVTPDQVREATQYFDQIRDDQLLRIEFDSRMRAELCKQIGTTVVSCFVLIIANLVATPGTYWCAWLVGALIAGVIAKAASIFNYRSTSYEREFQRWLIQRPYTVQGNPAFILEVDTLIHQFIANESSSHRQVSKLKAIKHIREWKGLDLKSSRDLVDGFAKRHPGYL